MVVNTKLSPKCVHMAPTPGVCHDGTRPVAEPSSNGGPSALSVTAATWMNARWDRPSFQGSSIGDLKRYKTTVVLCDCGKTESCTN